MTAQTMEKLIFNGKEVSMATEPLASFLETFSAKYKLVPTSTACWRGYIGKWEVIDEKLYLIEFKGNVGIPLTSDEMVDMDFLFPNQQKVLADWFTGEIRIPQGNLLHYVHLGYASTYESNMFLEFKNGRLVMQRTVDNFVRMAEELINIKKTFPKRIPFHTKIIEVFKKKLSIFYKELT